MVTFSAYLAHFSQRGYETHDEHLTRWLANPKQCRIHCPRYSWSSYECFVAKNLVLVKWPNTMLTIEPTMVNIFQALSFIFFLSVSILCPCLDPHMITKNHSYVGVHLGWREQFRHIHRSSIECSHLPFTTNGSQNCFHPKLTPFPSESAPTFCSNYAPTKTNFSPNKNV